MSAATTFAEPTQAVRDEYDRLNREARQIKAVGKDDGPALKKLVAFMAEHGFGDEPGFDDNPATPPLTADERASLMELMVEAKAKGYDDLVARIAEAEQDPAAGRAILGLGDAA